MPINERDYNMQMKKAILRNSEIVIFDKKKFAAAQVRFFFQPAGSETVFVFTSAQWNFVGKLYALKTKKRTLLTSGLLAYMIQKKVPTYILEEHAKDSLMTRVICLHTLRWTV